MIRLWKNLRKNLRESMWENCEKVSTVLCGVCECVPIWWKKFDFHENLHEFCRLISTRRDGDFTLFSRRFCTVST